MSTRVEDKLGEILLRLGYVHPEQVTEALELQKIRPKRIGELLMDLGYIRRGGRPRGDARHYRFRADRAGGRQAFGRLRDARALQRPPPLPRA